MPYYISANSHLLETPKELFMEYKIVRAKINSTIKDNLNFFWPVSM